MENINTCIVCSSLVYLQIRHLSVQVINLHFEVKYLRFISHCKTTVFGSNLIAILFVLLVELFQLGPQQLIFLFVLIALLSVVVPRRTLFDLEYVLDPAF